MICIMRFSLTPVVILLLASVARSEDAAPVWKPQRTWVFAVSATAWKFDRSAPLPRKSRHDEDLIKTFKARGVPEDHITFLKDKQGTIAQIHKLLPEMLKRTGPGDTVIVYFQ